MGDPSLRFVVLLHPVEGRERDEPLIRRHVGFLKQLESAGQLDLAGPFVDGSGGMLVLKVEYPEQAEEIAGRDPFVVEGVARPEIRAWRLSNADNNHLGMG